MICTCIHAYNMISYLLFHIFCNINIFIFPVYYNTYIPTSFLSLLAFYAISFSFPFFFRCTISMPTPKIFPVYTRIDLEPPVYVDDASSGVDVHARKVDVNSGRFDDSRKVDGNPVDSRKVDVNGNVDYVQVGVDSGKVDIYPKSVEKVAGKYDSLPEKIDKDTSEGKHEFCYHYYTMYAIQRAYTS